MSNPTDTAKTDALKAERLHAFITLAKVSPLAIANVLANVIDALDKSEAKVADLLGTLDGETEETKALEKQKARLREELDARTAEFEEKYYGLEMENRRLRKTIELREGSIAELKKRLAQAEAALGVPCSDEWDVYSDAGMRGA